MSKIKVRLKHGEMKMLIPLYSTLLFEDLKNEVQKRFKIKATGFVVDSYHISLADEIGDIIENPRDELIDILTKESGSQPWANTPDDMSVEEDMVPKSMYDELQKKLAAMADELNKYREGVHLSQQTSVVNLAMPGNVKSGFRFATVSTEVQAPESPRESTGGSDEHLFTGQENSDSNKQPLPSRGSDIEISLHIGQVDDKKTSVDMQLNGRSLDLDESECSPSKEESEGPGRPQSLEDREGEVSPSAEDRPKKSETAPSPMPDERKKAAEEHWALVEKNLAEKARLKAEADRAAREEEREKRRAVFGSTVPRQKDEAEVEKRQNAMKEQMMQKMSERLANRKGPRLKLEPTKKASPPKKKSSPMKKTPSPTKKSSPKSKTDDEELTLDPIEHESEEEKESVLSPRSQVAAKMAERMKERKGPRIILEPTRKPKPEPKRKKPKMVNKPRAPVNPSIAGYIDGEMKPKELKRMERMKLEIGDKLEISGHREGIVKFIGETGFSRGTIYGLELCDGSLGENSGTVDGVSYFECRENRGVFIPSRDIRKKFRKPKPKEPCRNVYRRRITRIFEEFNQSKIKNLENLLNKYEGSEHTLYINICKKYFVSPEKEYKDK